MLTIYIITYISGVLITFFYGLTGGDKTIWEGIKESSLSEKTFYVLYSLSSWMGFFVLLFFA